jgi:HTH-type transcriptional regulator/antitoxin HigA
VGGGNMIAEVGSVYQALIFGLPLVPIRDEDHYEAALEKILVLMKKGALRSSDETGYLEVLAMLVERYEDEHHPMGELKGVTLLRHLLAANGLPQKAIASELGGESVVSAILAGNRSLNAGQMARLADRFGVPAILFFEPSR